VRLTIASTILALSIVATGCGSPAPATSPASPSLSPVMAEHYTCDMVAFQPGILLQPGAAERDSDQTAETFRQFVSSPLNDGFLPTTGWRRLGRAGDFTEFANVVGDPGTDGYVSITFEFDGVRWTAFRWGTCQPRRVVQANLESLAWWLPRVAPDPTARSIAVNVIVDGCNAGPVEDAIEPPLIDIGEDRVTVILTGQRGGIQGCPAGGPTSWTIDLPDAIGTRALLDGSIFPARDATAEPLGFGGTGG